MGWAKYYEDNMSIIADRMREVDKPANLALYARERKVGANNAPRIDHVAVKDCTASIQLTNIDRTGNRRGLKLSFTVVVDPKYIRKLRVNGWWWSRTANAWVNNNTAVNREFAEKMIVAANTAGGLAV